MNFCPNCHSRTRLADNQFYGIGLAVHPFIRTCDTCDWSIFVSDAGQQGVPERSIELRPAAPAHKPRGLPAWIRGWSIGHRAAT